MARSHLWLWFLPTAFACALSVDDPAEDQAPPPPEFGNPFAPNAAPPVVYSGSGTAGASTDDADDPGEGAGGGGGSRPVEERRTPFLPIADAAAPECAADAGDCEDVLCLSNDDCHAGLCVNARCRSFCEVDADCRQGQACALGLCRSSPNGTWECFAGGDCPAGADCVSGSCLSRCSNDEHCADTEDGPVCSYGYCGR